MERAGTIADVQDLRNNVQKMREIQSDDSFTILESNDAGFDAILCTFSKP